MPQSLGADSAELLELAIRAATSGGAEVTARAGRATGVKFKSTLTDPASDADRASEAAVVGLITRERPRDGILGEEGAEKASATGLRWVIDPLDGTVNYLYGLPETTVSIAVEQACCDRGSHSGEPGHDGELGCCRDGWRPVVAAVYHPARNEMFTAVRDEGAWLNGEPISVGAPVELSQALISTGFGYTARSRARQAATVARLIPLARDIRSHGSAALELCLVAAGRCDGYYEDELARWDWAAGALIAGEAGAAVCGLGSGIVVAAPTIYKQLTTVLREH